MPETKRTCGHPLGRERWCPECALAESRASQPFVDLGMATGRGPLTGGEVEDAMKTSTCCSICGSIDGVHAASCRLARASATPTVTELLERLLRHNEVKIHLQPDGDYWVTVCPNGRAPLWYWTCEATLEAALAKACEHRLSRNGALRQSKATQ